MSVRLVTQLSELSPYQGWWDEHAGGCPFRSWTWLSTWWKHYGCQNQLFVLLVITDSAETEVGHLLGILPAYLETTHMRGRVLKLLGDGEVCSEHLDLILDPAHKYETCRQIAEYLASHASDWDSFSLTALNEKDRHLGLLIEELATRDCPLHRVAGVNCWSIPLPGTWEDFLAMQSKSHRKQLRQLKSRVLESARAKWIRVKDPTLFDTAWTHLVDLHQRRRQSLGEPGCFASSKWSSFHLDVAPKLLESGALNLSVLELDGNPIAAEYHLTGYDATYAYQGGIDPDRREEEPGQLSMILCVKEAIKQGHNRFELLRGDEPYKPHWRAVATPTVNVDVVSPRSLARWRHTSWTGIRRAGRLLRQLTNSFC